METPTKKEIAYNMTRPTSVVVMLLLFQVFQLAFPKVMGDQWQRVTLDAITVVGGTGIIDKAWRNRKEIKEFFKSIFTKKKK